MVMRKLHPAINLGVASSIHNYNSIDVIYKPSVISVRGITLKGFYHFQLISTHRSTEHN